MTDVKDLCDRLVATAPPLRSSDAVLGAARRSARRRGAGIASVGLLTTTALVAVGLAVQPAAPGQRRAAPPPAVAARTTLATTAAPATTGLPPARAAASHGDTMQRLLDAAVPPGFATAPQPIGYDESLDRDAVLPDAEHPVPGHGLMSVAMAGVMIRDHGREGALTAVIFASSQQLPPCTPDASRQCSTADVGGVRIEVTTWRDQVGSHIAATRRLKGGILTVGADQGWGSNERVAPPDAPRTRHGARPPLATLPFTTDQIAALAANPRMLQFP